MKVRFSTKELEGVLGRLGAVVDTSNKLEIFTHARLTIVGGAASFTAVSLGASATARVPVKEATDGDVIFPFARVSEIVSKLGAEEVIFETSGERKVKVTAPGTQYVADMNTDDIAKFPVIAEEMFSNVASIGLPGFRDMIGKVSFAVPKADGKYTVTTALLHATNKELRLVATDGKQLSLSSIPFDSGSDFQVQMPKLALELVDKFLAGSTAVLSESGTTANEGAFRFTGENGDVLIVRKTSGAFPPYERVIPKENPKGAVTLKQAQAMTVLGRLSAMLEKDNPVLLATYSGKTISLNVSGGYGFGYDVIDVEPVGGAEENPFKVPVHKEFLNNWFDKITGDVTFFVPSSDQSPLLFVHDRDKFLTAPVVIASAAAKQ